MKWTDILAGSLGNMWRRKLRSVLTMMGVAIGTAAITIMVSLGLAMEHRIMEDAQRYTDLTVINVYNYGGGIIYDPETGEQSQGIAKINDAVIKQFAALQHVQAVTPVVWFGGDATIKQGKYQLEYPSFTAMHAEQMAAFGLQVAEGQPLAKGGGLSVILGPMTRARFVDSRASGSQGGKDPWQTIYEGGEPELVPIDWLNASYKLIWRYWQENPTDPTLGSEMKKREFKLKVAGVLDVDYMSQYSDMVLIDIDALKQLITDKKNKDVFDAYYLEQFDNYQTVMVKVNSVENVETVLSELKAMGVQCDSPMQWIEQYREQIRSTQMFLSAIGAISLLVAALGIANTMLMSIIERTREIGVMKVLGCRLGNIRALFLMEAGFIGIFGGLLGVLISAGLSLAMNKIPAVSQFLGQILGGIGMGGEAGTISVIPLYLALGAWAFGFLIAVISGIYPAQRAMRLSSLAAIRNQN